MFLVSSSCLEKIFLLPYAQSLGSFILEGENEGWRRDEEGATSCHADETVRRPDSAADGRFSAACEELTS
jgi:hypothetical protein